MSRKLEVGSGNLPKEGYEHLDINPNCPQLDFCCSFDKIPVSDGTFSELLSIHSIEHISWRKIKNVLREWNRVLQVGGLVHIECPNLRWIAKSYLENSSAWTTDRENMYPEEQAFLKVKSFHSHTMWANFKLFSSTVDGDIHLACYDAFILGQLLEEQGFSNIKVLQDDSTLVVEARKW